MSASEELLSEFLEGGEERVKLACQAKEHEDPFLDFKSTRSTDGKLEEDDKRNLGSNLSGFANTEGGLLIWGVKEERDAKGGKKLTATSIPNVKEFVRSLNEELSRCVSRPVIGARNEMIELPDGSGYVLTYVPDSPDKPHMCVAGREYRYYLRSGDSTVKITSHNLVEALMHHRKTPKFELFLERYHVEHAPDKAAHHAEYRAFFALRNNGSVLARHVAVTLRRYQDRLYIGQVDLKSYSIVHCRFEDEVEHEAVQFRTAPDCIVYPGMTIHNIELIQPIHGNIGLEQAIQWRVDAEGFSETGVFRMENPPMLM